MPTLHSLSIRRRGTTPVKSSSAPPATTTSTIKGLFHRKTFDTTSRKSTETTRKSSLEKTTDAMGNAPSDMNGKDTNGLSRQKPHLVSTSSDRDSIRSRAMPGAEPPTPAPEPVFEKTEDQRSPEPDTVQVQGYDTQDVPHIFHDNPQASVEPDLEAGLIPPVGSFEVEEAQRPQSQEAVEAELAPQPDAARTPRVELKPEEGLAPLDIGAVAPPSHAVEGSDATAVAVSPRIGSPATKFAPGTYVLLNARSGTAMDLSGADGKTVIGYSMHGGPNQQWEFIPTGHGYIIRCVRRSKEGHALYLTTAGGLRDGEEIVASTFPVTWNVEQTEDGIRISWPNSEYVFDLADWGNSAPGTKIQLATRKSSEACQHWHYTRCAPASDPEPQTDGSKEVGREAVSARAVSPPATTETVTVTEERDFVTTTRTTTTTVITTVTEVTRTPKSMFRQIALPQRRSIAYR